MTQLRGVNLGGWLVVERWMTPSLFAGTKAVDEYTFMQTPGAKKKLQKHRETFITEADFRWLHDHSLNAIRLPIGYWLFAPDRPFEPGIHYVDWAFQMAEKYKLHVLLDLHGAPKSQNGHDHSGQTGQVGWFNDLAARQHTVTILKQLHERYKNSPSYWGIELLNEPRASWRNHTLRQFYTEASRALPGSQCIVFHDGFRPRTLSGALAHDPRAVMDIHLYHMASWLARYVSAEQFMKLVGWWWGRLLRHLAKRQPVIIGEWSSVLKGETLDHLSTEEASQLQHRFGARQLEIFERTSIGWFYWSYKTEDPASLWNFKQLVENGRLIVPK